MTSSACIHSKLINTQLDGRNAIDENNFEIEDVFPIDSYVSLHVSSTVDVCRQERQQSTTTTPNER